MDFRILHRTSIALGIAACCAIATASAQQTTEQYIPIGQSPGVSDRYSYIGEIVAVDRTNHTITVEHASGRVTIRVTNNTRLWLDRSKRRRANDVAGYEDCEVGRRVEVMHLREDERTADWIKIEAR